MLAQLIESQNCGDYYSKLWQRNNVKEAQLEIGSVAYEAYNFRARMKNRFLKISSRTSSEEHGYSFQLARTGDKKNTKWLETLAVNTNILPRLSIAAICQDNHGL